MSPAFRARVSGRVQGVGFRDAVRREAERVGALGWVRNADDGDVLTHVEGTPESVEAIRAFLARGPEAAHVAAVATEDVPIEGHEQFAIRGVSAGIFVVQQHWATAPHYDFRLEVDGVLRSWAVPKGPSLDPAVKRFAVAVPDHSLPHATFEGATGDGRGVIVWDRGTYEQGGRVPWPEAIDRGHAVFVLHGEKLRGGFALQRTGKNWLLIKRRDDAARPGSGITSERPESVLSGLTLEALTVSR